MCETVRSKLPLLWKYIEDAHYSYLETDDSPEKLQQKSKLEGFIMEYLSLVPHDCKFGLPETKKVFDKTLNGLPNFSAYKASLGWAALARYALNLLAQPWRKEFRIIRLYSGYYKHEVEANLVGAEIILFAMGYRSIGAGQLALDGPVCPDMVSAISRDALIAQCECQIMVQLWERALEEGKRVTWLEVANMRALRHPHCGDYAPTPQFAGSEIYSNLPPEPYIHHDKIGAKYNFITHCNGTNINGHPAHLAHPNYILPPHSMIPQMYPLQYPQISGMAPCLSQMAQYGPSTYYYNTAPTPYMLPAPVMPIVKQAMNVPLNGCPTNLIHPSVPTAKLIELDTSSVYENEHQINAIDRRSAPKSSNSNQSMTKSDTDSKLNKAKEGMGTYESWDYVFRNLSSKDDRGIRNKSLSFDRDSRTLERLDKDDRRFKYQQTTLDLEDGMQALNIDQSSEDDAYRTARVNENLMKLKQEQEARMARQLLRKQLSEERKIRKPETVENPAADGLINNKVAPDKVRLLSKNDVKDRKSIIKQQSVNGRACDVNMTSSGKKVFPAASDMKQRDDPVYENGMDQNDFCARPASTQHDTRQELLISMDETDSTGPSKQNGRRDIFPTISPASKDNGKWECSTCTYLNAQSSQICDMCGKSKRGPEIEPLTSGGRECPVCTLVNTREAVTCDACGTNLEHCPTYI